MTLTVHRMRSLVAMIDYKPGYSLALWIDPNSAPDKPRYYLQVHFLRRDVVTGQKGEGRSGKRYVSQHMTPGEFVRACFGVFMALEEHECRENFTYLHKRIFGPYIGLDALMAAADDVEVRSG